MTRGIVACLAALAAWWMRLCVALAALVATGCLGSEVVECPGGGVCPPGLVCRLDRGEQLCALASCGNGVMESGESCDDGNNNFGDDCPGDCVALPVCGNGDREFGEACDDGNVVSGDGCQANCSNPVRPPARESAATAFDPTRGVMVMFAGASNTDFFDDLWERNETEWIQRFPSSPRPSARRGAAMTYDPVRRRVLMYGGMANTGEALDDTWEWDGATWSLLDTIEHPPSSEFLTFDTRRGLAVLVGGQPTEHWEWNGVAWILRQPPPFMVSPGMGGSMSYDAALDLTLCAPGGPDLWGWNGSSWTMQRFGPGPGGIVQLAYDAGRMRTVLVGVPDLRVWELVDGTLTEPSREPRPPGRQNFGLVYADQLGVLLFGGMINGSTWFDDTWLWDGTSWRELL